MMDFWDTLSERIAKKVWPEPMSGCWLWGGATSNGYARFKFGNSEIRGHRWMYEFVFGKIPAGDHHGTTCVLHLCDNPACVNPDHLFLGSHSDNMSDMKAKGRSARLIGSRNGRQKISDSDTHRMFELRSIGWTYSKIASEFHSFVSNIGRIMKNYDDWKTTEPATDDAPGFTYDPAIDDEVCNYCGKPAHEDGVPCKFCKIEV